MSFKVITGHPVAFESRDHTHPAGTAHDNSRNPKFNQLLFKLTGGVPLRVLDLGCSGGGFVKDMLDAGHVAIGIEGSDYSLLRKRAEWATIPGNLFTADVTRPFQVVERMFEPAPDAATEAWVGVKFDVVTAWEVMEHIPEEGLDRLIRNVLDHLAPGGIWVMSVSTQTGFHHVTVRDQPWWLELFARYGLANDHRAVRHFGSEWVRGPQQNAPGSFHLVLKRSAA